MALDMGGTGGELRRGATRVATLTTWQKTGKKVRYTVDYINQFAAGQGPPTAIALQVTPKVRRVYPIVSGAWADGEVSVDLMTASSEKTA